MRLSRSRRVGVVAVKEEVWHADAGSTTRRRRPTRARPGVNQVLREVVADALERLSDIDDRLRLITVTSVDTTPDLRRATVYLSSLSDDAAEVLADQRISLQRQIGRQVRLKRTPLLEFKPDPAVAHGFQVEEILRRLHGRPSDPRDGGGDGDDGGR